MMRTFLIAALGLLAGASSSVAPAAAGPTQGGDCTGHPSNTKLYVNVQGLRSSKGLVAVTLYSDDKSKFLVHHGSLYVGRVAAQSPSTRVCIFVPNPGIYAIAVYHDEDSSRKFNRNALGMPTEGFGFSNNPPTFFGLPNFGKVRLNVIGNGTQTTVNMRYP